MGNMTSAYAVTPQKIMERAPHLAEMPLVYAVKELSKLGFHHSAEVLKRTQRGTRMPLVLNVDLDDTLCIDNFQGYETREPNQPMVDMVKRAYKLGHEITICTARKPEHETVTIAWLAGHGIKYNTLVMGKPKADLYIDDRAIQPDDAVLALSGMFDEEEKQHNVPQAVDVRMAALREAHAQAQKAGEEALARAGGNA